jgi:tyrosine-protein kinase Etk/Wzc
MYKKSAAFLNKLTEVYQIDNLEKKNENANRTIQFISHSSKTSPIR